jgi:hypothetical protein
VQAISFPEKSWSNKGFWKKTKKQIAARFKTNPE